MNSKNFNKIAVVVFLLFIFIAHLVVIITESRNYLWYRNTISDLSAQGYNNKWIMQTGFWIFGLMLMFNIIKHKIFTKKFISSDIFISLYGLFIFLTGIFCIKPFITNISFSESENYLHSIFATLTGIAISFAMIMYIFPITKNRCKLSILGLIFTILVIGSSAIFGILESEGFLYNGLVQRIMWIFGLIWLYFVYNKDIN